MQSDQLRTRILTWAGEQARLNKLLPKVDNILEALLYRREPPRGAAAIVGTGERQARSAVSALIDQGVVTSERTRDCAALFPWPSPRGGYRDCFRRGRGNVWIRLAIRTNS